MINNYKKGYAIYHTYQDITKSEMLEVIRFFIKFIIIIFNIAFIAIKFEIVDTLNWLFSVVHTIPYEKIHFVHGKFKASSNRRYSQFYI